MCRSNLPVVSNWHYVNDSIVTRSDDRDYYQIRDAHNTVLVRRQGSAVGPSGLWPCRPNGLNEGSSYIGLYHDGKCSEYKCSVAIATQQNCV